MKLHRMRAPPVPLLPHPSYAQVYSSARDFQAPSANVPPSV